jgi:hypothetical protein
MNLIKRKIFLLAVVTIAAAMFTEEVKAGGWPVRRKKLVVSASVNYFTATNIWDQKGNVKSYDNRIVRIWGIWNIQAAYSSRLVAVPDE